MMQPGTRVRVHLRIPCLLKIDGKEGAITGRDDAAHAYTVRVDGLASDVLVDFTEMEELESPSGGIR